MGLCDNAFDAAQVKPDERLKLDACLTHVPKLKSQLDFCLALVVAITRRVTQCPPVLVDIWRSATGWQNSSLAVTGNLCVGST